MKTRTTTKRKVIDLQLTFLIDAKIKEAEENVYRMQKLRVTPLSEWTDEDTVFVVKIYTRILEENKKEEKANKRELKVTPSKVNITNFIGVKQTESSQRRLEITLDHAKTIKFNNALMQIARLKPKDPSAISSKFESDLKNGPPSIVNKLKSHYSSYQNILQVKNSPELIKA